MTILTIRRLTLAVAALFLAIAFASPAYAQIAYTVTVKADQGRPIAGIAVTLTGADNRKTSAVTNSSGVAAFKVPPGNLLIEIDSSGFEPVKLRTVVGNANSYAIEKGATAATTIALVRRPGTPPKSQPSAQPPVTQKPPGQPQPGQPSKPACNASCEQQRLSCMSASAQKNSFGVPVTPPAETKRCWDGFYACGKQC